MQQVEAVHKETQYGAWLLVHGYNVNHFTALINSHKVPELDCIEKTAALLAAAGVPLKPNIEGERYPLSLSLSLFLPLSLALFSHQD